MTPGLKILIERMREHPEDFNFSPYGRDTIRGRGARWDDLISIANGLAENDCLSDEEVAAWIEAKKRLMVDTFNAKVLDAVNYVPPEPEPYADIGSQYQGNLARSMAQTKEAMRIDSSGNLGIGIQPSTAFHNSSGASLRIGSAGLSESDIKHIKKQAGLK